MVRLFVYRIDTDSGAAPHISDGYLTLTICKPKIRKAAQDGEYVLAVVSRSGNAMKTLKKTVAEKDRPFLAAYLFRVGDVVPMEKYDKWCSEHAPHKLCTDDYFEGDAQYNKDLKWRPGPHPPGERNKNIGGCNSLISTHFAAWTSTSPHRLTKEEITGLGLMEEDVAKLGRPTKIVELPNNEVVERLITSKKYSPNNKKRNSGAKCVSKNKTLKKNKNDKPNGSGRPSGKEGYTLF